MTVTVIGLGKIGLPLAVQFAMKGERVIGVDTNPQVVQLVSRGRVPFTGEPGLESHLRDVIQSDLLTVATNLEESVPKSEVVVVVVPLVVDDEGVPVFSSMDDVTKGIARNMQQGTLVIFETTLPIGTTRNRFTKILEVDSQMTVGIDFFVAFSPERVLTGRVFSDFRRYPKLVGGVTKSCTSRAAGFYERVFDFDFRADLERLNGVWQLSSSEAAEFVKLAETTYRDVNIGLVNQFALYAQGNNLNIYEVIEAANSQPFSHLHQPGVAVGGHCIPVYPQFYLWNDPNATIVRLAREVNSGMPRYTASLASHLFQETKNVKVLILGATYRAGVPELAFSGVFPLYQSLKSLGCSVEVFDPLLNSEQLETVGLTSLKSNTEDFSLVIIQNESNEFRDIFASRAEWKKLQFIIDGRNLFRGVPPLQGVSLQTLGTGIS